jgi:hypothetical protein
MPSPSSEVQQNMFLSMPQTKPDNVPNSNGAVGSVQFSPLGER